MKKKQIHSEDGDIQVSKLNNGSIGIALNENGCKYLIEELQELIKNKDYIFDYDSNTGYDCGILTKNSLGLIITRKD